MKKNDFVRALKFLFRIFLNLLPESYRRLVNSYIYNKEKFYLKSSVNVFEEIYGIDLWNSTESKSGLGSTLEATVSIRKLLPQIISQFSIKSILDVPCGDFNWMKEVDLACNYIGGDIVPDIVLKNQQLYSSSNVIFKKLDITVDHLPKVDLIICKDCLQHLSFKNVKMALSNFKKSGSKYLLVTSYPKTLRNHDIYDGDNRPLNLLISPFKLSNPVLKIKEESKAPDVEIDKTMYLFELSLIPDIDLE